MKILKKQHIFNHILIGLQITFVQCLVFQSTHAQLLENFTDNDFINAPTWTGTTADYIVNTNQQLQLNNTIAGTSYLSTPHNLTTFDAKEWRMWVKQAFAGSGTNYGRIYLSSNSDDLSTNPDGMYLQLGEPNSTDAVRLMQRNGASTTQICASTDGSIASSITYGIKVTRNNSGVWTLYIDASGGTDFVQISNGTEVAPPSGNHFGYLNVYTTSNATKFFMDSIFVGDIVVDTTPPVFTSVNFTDATHLKLTFSEPITQSTAEDLGNYIIYPPIPIVSAFQNPTNLAEVELTLGNALINGDNHSVYTDLITDLTGNVSNPQTLWFTYLVAEIPYIGDIILTEFFPDPSPSIGIPESEFVEIYNASTKIFNLNGWKLGDNSTFGTVLDGWLFPDQHIVLCPTAAVSLFPNAIGVTAFPSINNTSDDIKIQDDTGLLLDSLSFTLDWYHDETKQDGGWTIERINPAMPCSGKHNWKASVNVNGGTPGMQNSVFDTTPDTTAPAIQSIETFPPNYVVITFSKPVNGTLLANSAITISPTLTISDRFIDESLPTTFQLAFNETIEQGTLYQISLDNITDCYGNTTNLLDTFLRSGIPQDGEVIINEFMADPSPVVGLPEVEFVEIHNRSNKTFNISGWKLGDNSSEGTIQSGWLAPGEYKILCASSAVSDYPSATAVTSFPSFGNASDDIVLHDNTGTLLDKISYTNDWYKDAIKKEGGWSIERINPETPCSQSSNWKASVNPLGGTPGMQNSVFDTTPDTTPPTAISAFATGVNTVQLQFSEPVDSISLLNATITTDPNLTIASRTIPSRYTESLLLAFTTDFIASQTYTVSLSDVKDCIGNDSAITITFVNASQADSGNVIINEILFDPLTGGSDWIELYNKSNKIINLKNWKIAHSNNGELADIKILDAPYFLLPNEYVVLGSDSNFVIHHYPATTLGTFYQMTLPSLANDKGNIALVYPKITASDTTDFIMDKVAYLDTWHFKLLDDKDGKSLERRDPNLPTQDAKNWHTAAEAIGFGTPGGKNSQYYPALYNGNVHLSSETISPDNDGFEDLLQINYQMELSGMLATVKIFDDRGRIIKTVTSNELLGMTGTLIWDGIREDGQKASIGTYVVLVEAFDIHGGNEFVSKKAFVVAGKMN